MVYVITIFQKNFAIFVVYAKEDTVCLVLVFFVIAFCAACKALLAVYLCHVLLQVGWLLNKLN